MFVHEYSDEHFATYEDCRDDLTPEIDSDEIIEHMEVSMDDIISHFLRRTSDKDFDTWLSEQIDIAFERAIEDLITEYEEGEVE